jgi:hypothetical protein
VSRSEFVGATDKIQKFMTPPSMISEISEKQLMTQRRRSKPARVARFISNACMRSPALWEIQLSAPIPPPNRPCDVPAESFRPDPPADPPAVTRDAQLPLLYDIVPRGRMPAILFHDNMVEVLYRNVDAYEIC